MGWPEAKIILTVRDNEDKVVPKSAPILLRNCQMVWENGFLGSTFPLRPDDGKVFDNALPPSCVWNDKLSPLGTRLFEQEQRKAVQAKVSRTQCLRSQPSGSQPVTGDEHQRRVETTLPISWI